MTLRTLPVDLGPTARAWFTGAAEGPDPTVGKAGNLSHRRPHMPQRLAADRAVGFGQFDVDPDTVHVMKQVHGSTVTLVDMRVPVGAEVPDTDALVTSLPDRPLAVLTADCVPVLLAGRTHIGAVHAGRVGLAAGIVEATLDVLEEVGEDLGEVAAAVGPAIGACCYEVEMELADALEAHYPGASSSTTWSTPSIDLPGTVAGLLRARGVRVVDVGECTHCRPGWFSHRRDPGTGRQAGVIVRGSAA